MIDEGDKPENIDVRCMNCRTQYTTSPVSFLLQLARCPLCESTKAGLVSADDSGWLDTAFSDVDIPGAWSAELEEDFGDDLNAGDFF